MSWSRWLTIISAAAGSLSAVAGIANQFPPRVALIIAAVALFGTAFSERIQGGKSTADQ